ncbi:MAG: hypothetical protein QG638_2232 [Pseudomonadota bacterium]|nr:hypothetical protein [Pseudomonadota bacterium]MDQ5945454.1 hypothetical protein [Pseudomonadota bacterium]
MATSDSTVTTLPTAKHDSLVGASDDLNHCIAMLRFLSLGVERQRETTYTDEITAQIDFGEYLVHQYVIERLCDAHSAVDAAIASAQEQQRAA